jgi:hypothetical protein
MYTNLIKSGVASPNSEITIGNNIDISPDRKYAEVDFQSIMGDCKEHCAYCAKS